MKKHIIKKILVPIDFSETSEIALAEAISLSVLLNADLFLFHVMDYVEHLYTGFPEVQTLLHSNSELKNSVELKMKKMQVKISKEYGINIEVYIIQGHIHSEIIDFSIKENIDLIVMGTHGISGYKEFFIGANAQRVVTLSEIPVLTIQNKIKGSKLSNILIPIDNSIHSREKVIMAIDIAKLFGSVIHILGLPNSEEEHELNKFNTKIKSVETIVHEHNLQFVSSLIHGDNLAEEAIKYANKNNCDLIVINTGHESNLTGIFLGLFAQQIVNHSKIPVLSCKHTQDNYSITTPGFGV